MRHTSSWHINTLTVAQVFFHIRLMYYCFFGTLQPPMAGWGISRKKKQECVGVCLRCTCPQTAREAAHKNTASGQKPHAWGGLKTREIQEYRLHRTKLALSISPRHWSFQPCSHSLRAQLLVSGIVIVWSFLVYLYGQDWSGNHFRITFLVD